MRVFFFLDLGDETITALGQGFDEARRLGWIPQYAPDFENVFSEDFRLDKSVRPQLFKELFRCHQPANVINQELQDGEGLWRQWDTRIGAPQALIDGIEPVRGKDLRNLRYGLFRQTRLYSHAGSTGTTRNLHTDEGGMS